MDYSTEEWGWLEAEWAFHCHGRTAFMSQEDYHQARAWATEGIPADVIVAAMENYFERRAKRPRPRAFISLAHLKKDIIKAMSFRCALSRAGEAIESISQTWCSVKDPLKTNPKAKSAFEAWMRIKKGAPLPESTGYLEHLDAERRAYQAFVTVAAEVMGSGLSTIETGVAKKLQSVEIPEGSSAWKRAWDYHFSRDVCAAWGIDCV